MTADDLVERAAIRLAAAAGPEAKVILFGSRARGDARPDSDLDFVVIEPRVDGRHREMVRLRRALRGLAVPVDVLVYSEDQAAAWGEVPGTAIYAALREGRVVAGS